MLEEFLSPVLPHQPQTCSVRASRVKQLGIFWGSDILQDVTLEGQFHLPWNLIICPGCSFSSSPTCSNISSLFHPSELMGSQCWPFPSSRRCDHHNPNWKKGWQRLFLSRLFPGSLKYSTLSCCCFLYCAVRKSNYSHDWHWPSHVPYLSVWSPLCLLPLPHCPLPLLKISQNLRSGRRCIWPISPM